MTLLEIFQIEREIAENSPLPGLTVKRIPASNPDHIWLVLEWLEGTKPDRTKSASFPITTTGNCRWDRRLRIQTGRFSESGKPRPGAVKPAARAKFTLDTGESRYMFH